VFCRLEDPDAGTASASDTSDGIPCGDQILRAEVNHDIAWPGQAQEYARFVQSARVAPDRLVSIEQLRLRVWLLMREAERGTARRAEVRRLQELLQQVKPLL
jgi:hypothetical protein